jgi:hypothetical protein
MNTKQLKHFASFALILLMFACASKKEEAHSEAEDEGSWKEMDEYHMIMAETFHPYKDSANLEPVKSRAAELSAAAEKWAKATLPEKVNNEEMKNKLEQLRSESSALVQVVNSADEKVIADQLTTVHDLFHAIQEDWYGGGEDHGHAH